MLIGMPLSGVISMRAPFNSQQSVCIQTKAIGEQCDTDKEQHLYQREHVRYSFRILATLVSTRHRRFPPLGTRSIETACKCKACLALAHGMRGYLIKTNMVCTELAYDSGGRLDKISAG